MAVCSPDVSQSQNKLIIWFNLFKYLQVFN